MGPKNIYIYTTTRTLWVYGDETGEAMLEKDLRHYLALRSLEIMACSKVAIFLRIITVTIVIIFIRSS